MGPRDRSHAVPFFGDGVQLDLERSPATFFEIQLCM